ncbi:MAG: NADP-dependent oxidoreductase [Paracoccaceae bacterium]
MSAQMKRIVLASRPQGAADESNFRMETVPMPEPAEGEVLVRISHFSLDPYMRGRMDAGPSYAAPQELGAVMGAGAVGRVVASRDPGLAEGDMVFGMMGWADHHCLPGRELRKLPEGLPPSAALGVLGMPGFTGWLGLTEFGDPQQGETLVVAAATGPVGSMVGQIARLRGLRTVGIAGGAEKCRLATETFGFDACLDHRAHDDARSLRAALKEAAPQGVDIYFENVGGKVLEAVLPAMNTFGRIPLCGMIAWYDGTDAAGPDRLPMLWRSILVKRLAVRGFIISDHWDRLDSFLSEVAPLVMSGKVTYLEDVAEGLEAAPRAFLSMLKGGNTGKQLVRVGQALSPGR